MCARRVCQRGKRRGSQKGKRGLEGSKRWIEFWGRTDESGQIKGKSDYWSKISFPRSTRLDSFQISTSDGWILYAYLRMCALPATRRSPLFLEHPVTLPRHVHRKNGKKKKKKETSHVDEGLDRSSDLIPKISLGMLHPLCPRTCIESSPGNNKKNFESSTQRPNPIVASFLEAGCKESVSANPRLRRSFFFKCLRVPGLTKNSSKSFFFRSLQYLIENFVQRRSFFFLLMLANPVTHEKLLENIFFPQFSKFDRNFNQ